MGNIVIYVPQLSGVNICPWKSKSSPAPIKLFLNKNLKLTLKSSIYWKNQNKSLWFTNLWKKCLFRFKFSSCSKNILHKSGFYFGMSSGIRNSKVQTADGQTDLKVEINFECLSCLFFMWNHSVAYACVTFISSTLNHMKNAQCIFAYWVWAKSAIELLSLGMLGISKHTHLVEQQKWFWDQLFQMSYY